MIYNVVKWLARVVLRLVYNIEVIGQNNVPKDGPLIICPNHKSWIDPVLVGICMQRKIYFMAKEELFRFRIMGWFLGKLGAFSVRRGRADRAAIKRSLDVLKEGSVLGIFPEGTRNKSDGLGEARNGAAYFALKTKTPVQPVSINGRLGFRGRLKIVFGEPVRFSYSDGKVSSEGIELAIQKIMEAIARGM